MTFSAQPLFPGDIHDAALRVGSDFAARLASHADDAATLADQAAVTAGELGWSSLAIAEEHGGAQGSLADLGAIAEACGRSGLPLSVAQLYFTSAHLIGAGAYDDAARAALGALAEGRATFAIADGASGWQKGALVAQREGDGFSLTGEVAGVQAPGSVTDWLVVTRDGPTDAPTRMWRVPASAPGLSARRYIRMDGRPMLDLSFEQVRPAAQDLWLEGPALQRAWDESDRVAVLLAGAECIGAMGHLIELTIEYLGARKQFGQTLSSFQGLRHQLASIYVDYENARAQVQAAFAAAGDGLPARAAMSLLHLSLGRTGRRIAETAIQLHGGMGMTEELLAARLAKRLMMSAFENGGYARHLQLAAQARFADTQVTEECPS